MSEPSRFKSACPTIRISAIDVLTFPLTPRLSLRFATVLGMVLTYYDLKLHHIATRGLLSMCTTTRMCVCTHMTRSIVLVMLMEYPWRNFCPPAPDPQKTRTRIHRYGFSADTFMGIENYLII